MERGEILLPKYQTQGKMVQISMTTKTQPDEQPDEQPGGQPED